MFGASVSKTYAVKMTVSAAPQTGAYDEHKTTRVFYLSAEAAGKLWEEAEQAERAERGA